MEFRLPELGEGVLEGELVKWRVQPGEQVKHDQPLCDIMTDKATIEIPSPFEGTVKELHAKEGATVKVEELLITFEGAGAGAQASSHTPKATESKAGNGSAKPESTPNTATIPAAQAHAFSAATAGDMSPATRVLAAPSTRRAAREMGVDLSRVQGSGPNGRVMRADVERAAGGGAAPGGTAQPGAGAGTMEIARPQRTFPSGGETREPLRGLRKKIAENMRRSKDHAAHFTYVEEADATELVKLRTQAKEIGAQQGVKVTFIPFVMKAMVAALRQFPIINSEFDEERQEVVYKHFYNIGLSIQTDNGLVAPVVKDVEHKSVLEIARDVQQIADRARTNRLTLDDYKAGTITLTSIGSIGGLFATPVINHPQVAILGLNKIFKTPVVVEVNGKDEIQIRHKTYFSISLDHRIVDGAVGAEFMKVFIRYIENPSLLLLESV